MVMKDAVIRVIDEKKDKGLDVISKLLASRHLDNGDRARVQVVRREFSKLVSAKGRKQRLEAYVRAARTLDSFKSKEGVEGVEVEVCERVVILRSLVEDLRSLYWFVDAANPAEDCIGREKVDKILARECVA